MNTILFATQRACLGIFVAGMTACSDFKSEEAQVLPTQTSQISSKPVLEENASVTIKIKSEGIIGKWEMLFDEPDPYEGEVSGIFDLKKNGLLEYSSEETSLKGKWKFEYQSQLLEVRLFGNEVRVLKGKVNTVGDKIEWFLEERNKKILRRAKN